MVNTAIQVEGLGKRYRLGLTQTDSLTDLAASITRRIFQTAPRSAQNTNNTTSDPDFWALKDVNLSISRGEVFGIIGRNGAGKSTLLKLISRVTSPTTGTIDMWGRVASLLEVGTGFHPDLTGRENVFMNATLLGMSRKEVRRKIDDIVDFSGVEKFFDTQVKRYSSGMRVRLGFAVAAHLQPDILIVDEVLAVGDAEFQRKCLGKMKEVANDGRTVLFVSHNMAAVRGLCTRACLLEEGRMTAIGDLDEIVNNYVRTQGERGTAIWRWRSNTEIQLKGLPRIRPIQFSSTSEDGTPCPIFTTSQAIVLQFTFELLHNIDDLRIGFLLRNQSNVTVFGSNTTNTFQTSSNKDNTLSVSCIVPKNLLNQGIYSVDIGVDRIPMEAGKFLQEDAICFEVTDVEGHGIAAERLPGVVRPCLQWRIGGQFE
ncbi:ABC transporter ATP-binding protein [Neorhodopirellula pilleata]|nr:ABC transporter ATP-binding protein [Neorhodopirellula pilleata]